MEGLAPCRHASPLPSWPWDSCLCVCLHHSGPSLPCQPHGIGLERGGCPRTVHSSRPPEPGTPGPQMSNTHWGTASSAAQARLKRWGSGKEGPPGKGQVLRDRKRELEAAGFAGLMAMNLGLVGNKVKVLPAAGSSLRPRGTPHTVGVHHVSLRTTLSSPRAQLMPPSLSRVPPPLPPAPSRVLQSLERSAGLTRGHTWLPH